MSLPAVKSAMEQAGHRPHPPCPTEPYSREHVIVCATCGARCECHLASDGTAEVTADYATAVPCNGRRHYL